MRKAYGYIRVSTTMQSLDGCSLKNQAERISLWCSQSGYEFAGLFEDTCSGSKLKNREGLKQALDAVTRDKAVLVVYSLSRLSRSITDAIEITKRLEKAGSALVSLSEKVDLTSASGNMLFQMLCVFSQGERAQLAERVKSAMNYKARQGKLVSRLPFGKSLAADGETLVENKDEADTLAIMQELSREGKSLSQIVFALESQGRKSKRGGQWKRECVRMILKRNPVLLEVAA